MNFGGNNTRAAFRRKIPFREQKVNTPLTFELAVRHYIQGHKINEAVFGKMLLAYSNRFAKSKTGNVEIIAQIVAKDSNVKYSDAYHFASWILWADKLRTQKSNP